MACYMDLIQKYPRLFRQTKLPVTQSNMAFGVECEPGWRWLLEALCEQLQSGTDNGNHAQVEFSQIKEKFGQLVVYWNFAEDEEKRDFPVDWEEICGIVSAYEHLSGYICEVCGNPGGPCHSGTWLKTLCANCCAALGYESGSGYEDSQDGGQESGGGA